MVMVTTTAVIDATVSDGADELDSAYTVLQSYASKPMAPTTDHRHRQATPSPSPPPLSFLAKHSTTTTKDNQASASTQPPPNKRRRKDRLLREKVRKLEQQDEQDQLLPTSLGDVSIMSVKDVEGFDLTGSRHIVGIGVSSTHRPSSRQLRTATPGNLSTTLRAEQPQSHFNHLAARVPDNLRHTPANMRAWYADRHYMLPFAPIYAKKGMASMDGNLVATTASSFKWRKKHMLRTSPLFVDILASDRQLYESKELLEYNVQRKWMKTSGDVATQLSRRNLGPQSYRPVRRLRAIHGHVRRVENGFLWSATHFQEALHMPEACQLIIPRNHLNRHYDIGAPPGSGFFANATNGDDRISDTVTTTMMMAVTDATATSIAPPPRLTANGHARFLSVHHQSSTDRQLPSHVTYYRQDLKNVTLQMKRSLKHIAAQKIKGNSSSSSTPAGASAVSVTPINMMDHPSTQTLTGVVDGQRDMDYVEHFCKHELPFIQQKVQYSSQGLSGANSRAQDALALPHLPELCTEYFKRYLVQYNQADMEYQRSCAQGNKCVFYVNHEVFGREFLLPDEHQAVERAREEGRSYRKHFPQENRLCILCRRKFVTQMHDNVFAGLGVIPHNRQLDDPTLSMDGVRQEPWWNDALATQHAEYCAEMAANFQMEALDDKTQAHVAYWSRESPKIVQDHCVKVNQPGEYQSDSCLPDNQKFCGVIAPYPRFDLSKGMFRRDADTQLYAWVEHHSLFFRSA
jgi:hypothetical protein